MTSSTPTSFSPTSATTATRHRERVGYDRAATYAAIDAAFTCHLGFVLDDRPFVLPQLYARVGDELYVHGSSGARALRSARGDGLPVCVTITHVDGLVLARSAFNHSINYRSVVVHGIATEVTGADEKQRALAHIVDAVAPGRSAEVRGPSAKELAATTVLRVPLHEASLKVRTGQPVDEDDDLGLPYWAGVLPLTSFVAGTPVPAEGLAGGIATPPSVSGWRR